MRKHSLALSALLMIKAHSLSSHQSFFSATRLQWIAHAAATCYPSAGSSFFFSYQQCLTHRVDFLNTRCLQDVMRFANVSIVPVTAHHGIHESIFSTQSPVEYDLEVPGSVLNARLTRSTTMDTWLPVLACVCRDDIGPGDFVIAGPDSSSEDQESQQQQDLQGGSWVATGVGDPEKLDISRDKQRVDRVGVAAMPPSSCEVYP
jgi:hypothetical protein